MKKTLLLLAALAASAVTVSPVEARDRYSTRPPVVVSPDLAAPWVMQLGRKPGRVVKGQRVAGGAGVLPRHRVEELMGSGVPMRAVRRPAPRRVAHPPIDPMYLPREVSYPTDRKPGTIVIDTRENFLYLVEGGGKARRYGVGTGKPGFEWAGTHKITRKAVWPSWTPPEVMKVRERANGRILPDFMPGGPENPMGARALYIGSTEYRIHGTNQPWTIGGAVSSGCIRMRNEDVVDLYEHAKVGATVVVM